MQEVKQREHVILCFNLQDTFFIGYFLYKDRLQEHAASSFDTPNKQANG